MAFGSEDIKHTCQHRYIRTDTHMHAARRTHIGKQRSHNGKAAAENKWSIVLPCTSNDFNWTRDVDRVHTRKRIGSCTHSLWHFETRTKSVTSQPHTCSVYITIRQSRIEQVNEMKWNRHKPFYRSEKTRLFQAGPNPHENKRHRHRAPPHAQCSG